MKKFTIVLMVFLLAVFISACNGTENGENGVESVNGLQENGIDNGTPGDLPGGNDSVAVPALPPEGDTLERFLQLALEMDAGDQTTTRERLVEFFGEPTTEDDSFLDFAVEEDFGVMALLSGGRVVVISISPIPDFFIDETLVPDYERLGSYMLDTDGLTLEYFRELFGTPGFLTTYSDGVFSYTWRSSAFSFWADVRGNNEVVSVFFEDYFDPVFDDIFEQGLLVLPDDFIETMHELTREMQNNNGQISEARAKEIIGLEYIESEQFLIFTVIEGLNFFAIIEESGMIEHVSMSPTINFYLVESLPIDINELMDLANDAENRNMTLEEFEDAIGSPGTLWHYTYNEFTYIWISPGVTVLIGVNQDNEIFEATVSQFVG